jgi:hypothetical protein
VRDDYIPETVVTRVARFRPAYVVGDTNDLLALAAMPLAVAAVADLTGIPFGDLSSLVSSLNAARVPPVQFVEVLRYSPVVMVDQYERPRFVQFVNTQVGSGVTGARLIEVIDDRLRTYDVAPRFDAVQVNVVDDRNFFPAAVTSRVAAVRAHPHGGPPGQLKKERGLQTGAEVVHGTTRVATSRARTDDVRVQRETRSSEPRVTKQRASRSERRATREVKRVEQPRIDQPKVDRQPKSDRKPKAERSQPGNAGGQGQGQGESKGKGKGKG